MTEPHDISAEMGDFFIRAHRALDRLMAAHGASLARVKLLFYIANHPGTRSADLAQAFGLAPRTITESVDGLERDGLVRRRSVPEDRRVKRLEITEAGQAVIASAEPSRTAFLTHLYGGLPQEERDVLIGLIRKLNARLASLDDPAPAAEGA